MEIFRLDLISIFGFNINSKEDDRVAHNGSR